MWCPPKRSSASMARKVSPVSPQPVAGFTTPDERVGDRVEVGADVQAVKLGVVAGVDDGDDLAGSTTACRPASILAAPTPPQRTAITDRRGGRGPRPPRSPPREGSTTSSRDEARPSLGSRALRCSSPGRAGAVARDEVAPGGGRHELVELGHRGLLAGADVEHETAAPTRRAGEGVHDVVDVDVVAVWLPSPKMTHWPPGDEVAGEDRDDAGLAVRVLARAVDVGEREGGELEAVQLAGRRPGSRSPPSSTRRRARAAGAADARRPAGRQRPARRTACLPRRRRRPLRSRPRVRPRGPGSCREC